MQEATILIPDISGYTRFLTRTELSHSTHIVNELLQVIADTLQGKFILAEIEGDALLTYAKGRMDRQELEAICQEVFKNFHYYLKVIERDRVCRCGACQNASDLSLKFIAHHGYFDEIKIAQFTKLSGPDMIIAHRLLKNNVPVPEYILMTKTYADQEGETPTSLEWKQGQDDYSIIGEVEYRYASLDHLRKEVPDPERLEDLSKHFGLARKVELEIGAPLALVHGTLTDNAHKIHFVPGLVNLEVDSAINRIGSTHICEFDGDKFDIQTLQEVGTKDNVVYIERAKSMVSGQSMLAYYELKKLTDVKTSISFRALTNDRKPIPEPFEEHVYTQSLTGLQHMKEYIETQFANTRKAG